MKSIKIKDLCGEFCTKRNNQGMDTLKKELQQALGTPEKILMDFSGIKIISVSFIDELFCALMVSHKIPQNDLNKYVEFKPALAPIYVQQISRGIRLRTKRAIL